MLQNVFNSAFASVLSSILLFLMMFSPFLHAQEAARDLPALEAEPAKNDSFSYKFNDLSVTTRYRVQKNSEGSTTHDRVQLKLNFDLSLLFFKDKVQVNLQGGTGSTFGSSWSNTGIGDADEDIETNLRRLSLTFKPAHFFQVEAGSMAPAFGSGTDNTYFDSDGYIMGYRSKVSYDKTELVMTGGFVGDFAKPKVVSRAESRTIRT